MRVTEGDHKFEARFDGRDYPVEGQPKHTVSLKLVHSDTIDQTDKEDGKVVTTTRTTVSKDGNSMKVESIDKVRGGRMTYTAEKKP
jgi:hypothetical protein